jgi:hypothetical protein
VINAVELWWSVWCFERGIVAGGGEARVTSSLKLFTKNGIKSLIQIWDKEFNNQKLLEIRLPMPLKSHQF